jgi:hypothetical protein
MSSINKLNIFLAIMVATLALLNFWPQESGYIPLTNTNPDDITSITISSKQRQLQFNKNNQQWVLPALPDADIEAETISRLLGIVKTHSHRQFLNNENNQAVFGLSPPKYSLKLNQLEIQFGSTDPVQQLRYILVNNRIHLINDLYLQFLLADEKYFFKKAETQN